MTGARSDDERLLDRVQAGDEAAFTRLVDRHSGAMLRLARTFVPTEAVAEEVVQDTWMGVVRGLDRFERRSSFRTWLYRILVNRARTTGAREPRHAALEPDGPTVDPDRFDANGAWRVPPPAWTDIDERLDADAWGPSLRRALGALTDRQRQVVLLRDVDGLSGPEVCDLLGLSEANQRVLLHRARGRLRAHLELELAEGGR